MDSHDRSQTEGLLSGEGGHAGHRAGVVLWLGPHQRKSILKANVAGAACASHPGMPQAAFTIQEPPLHAKERPMPEESQAELFARLFETSPEFQRLARKHREYDHAILDMDRIYYFTSEQERKRKELQKRKLALKDQMQVLLAAARNDGRNGTPAG